MCASGRTPAALLFSILSAFSLWLRHRASSPSRDNKHKEERRQAADLQGDLMGSPVNQKGLCDMWGAEQIQLSLI